MSELNKIVTNFPMSLTDEENRNLALTLSAVVEGGGGGGVANAIWKPAVDQDGDLTWSWDTFPDSARPPEAVNIKGPKGESGAPGRDGTNGTNGTNGKDGKDGTDGKNGEDGKTPQIQINSSNAHWEWRYSGASEWTDLGVVASGAVGPQGIPGASGAPGAPGEDGEPGDDGFSPAVTMSAITNPQHPNGGTRVTITDKTHPTGQYFDIFNGNDGSGSSDQFDLSTMSGYGTEAAPYGVDTTVIATQAWVEQKGYLTSVPDSYATKAYANDTSANALNQAQSWVGSQGFLTQADLSSYATETYVANASAETLSEADGRYMRKETDSTLDGVGTSADKLRISDTVMDEIENKSHVYMTSAGNVSVENTSGTVDANFVQYGQVGNRPIPRMLLCATADTYTEIVENVLPAASGMGAVIFVIESH